MQLECAFEHKSQVFPFKYLYNPQDKQDKEPLHVRQFAPQLKQLPESS